MSRALRSIDDLRAAGLTAAADPRPFEQVAARYAVSLTPEIAALIDPGDPDDPIARQFLPDARELVSTADELADPIGDAAHSPVEGIVHRYPDRVLLKPLHVCPVYCRFCFRRETVGPDGAGTLSQEALARALDYIRRDAAIWEVILTGGDPFALSPRRLVEIAAALRDIPHVRVLRVHTRVPVVDPAAVTEALVSALKTFDRAVFVALHANHPRELTPAARAACARLVDAGVPMVSQSVLLRGVNDTVETLAALMRAFVEARVKPYYLHHPDLAPGTSHLRVSIAEGQALMRGLLGRVSGLCQPAYVLDIPGGHGKSPVGPRYVEIDADGVSVEDFRGARHEYVDARGGGSTATGAAT
jgi:lysine 2,3-aminomutase